MGLNIDDDTGRFAALLTAWRTAEQAAESVRAAHNEQQLARWSEQLAAMAAEERRIRAEGAWRRGPRDLLGVLGWARVELAHVQVLAWLLDPSARHGLGVRLLSGVLARAFPPPTVPDHRLTDAVVRVRPQVGERKPDLVVTTGRTSLVIELRLDDPPAEEAWQTLHETFSAWGKAPSYLLITPDGRQPRQDRQGPPPVATLSLPDIAELLAELAADGTEPGLHAVRTYLETLRAEFP